MVRNRIVVSLRTLFVVILIVGIVLGWLRDRNALLHEIRQARSKAAAARFGADDEASQWTPVLQAFRIHCARIREKADSK